MTVSATATLSSVPDPVASAKAAGLRYTTDTKPGIRRQRRGRHFTFVDADGHALRSASELARIKALVIPPAWRDVWICPDPRGHLQATGRDARGRKQYGSHPRWRDTRDESKDLRMIGFAQSLPALRRRLRADLKQPGLPREKVLAIVVSLMADLLLRVGNDEYARHNRSYGLTTLRDHHVAFPRRGRARFRFRGKSGLAHERDLDDARLAKLVRSCQELPGQVLFQYRDDEGKVRPIDSSDVNDYLRTAMGDAYTAKDFRTWGGTLIAFRRCAAIGLPQPQRNGRVSERALAAVRNTVIAEVADVLGNTPAVCRKAYIDPRVFAGWEDGSLSRYANGAVGARQWERAALRFLKRAQRS